MEEKWEKGKKKGKYTREKLCDVTPRLPPPQKKTNKREAF